VYRRGQVLTHTYTVLDDEAFDALPPAPDPTPTPTPESAEGMTPPSAEAP